MLCVVVGSWQVLLTTSVSLTVNTANLIPVPWEYLNPTTIAAGIKQSVKKKPRCEAGLKSPARGGGPAGGAGGGAAPGGGGAGGGGAGGGEAGGGGGAGGGGAGGGGGGGGGRGGEGRVRAGAHNSTASVAPPERAAEAHRQAWTAEIQWTPLAQRGHRAGSRVRNYSSSGAARWSPALFICASIVLETFGFLAGDLRSTRHRLRRLSQPRHARQNSSPTSP